jgi:PhnB protein
MFMQVQPYLYFDGRCAEAIEFYTKAIGAEATAMMRYKESPDPAMCPPGSAEKIMHASFRIGQTTVLASDGQCEGRTTYQGFSLAILADGDDEAERLFAALGQGGQVQMPMSATFFASRFGMVSDRFGVSWMVLNPRHKR